MTEFITNSRFLEDYGKGQVKQAILVPEVQLARRRMSEFETRKQQIIKEKTDVTEQSGDNWHDGAFKATDDAASILAGQAERITAVLNSLIVDFPDITEPRATLGSRVRLKQNRYTFGVNIIGLPLLRSDDDSEITSCSIEAPIAKAIIGKSVGQTALVLVGKSIQEVEILAVDQAALREEFANELAE